MIPEGRPTLDLDDVARLAGVSVSTWRRHHHKAFTTAVKPIKGQGRNLKPLIYDERQVVAYLAGEPIPALPSDPHPDDLLTDREAGDVAGIDGSTVRADAAEGRMDRGTVRHGRRWWTRIAAEQRASRTPQYKGRTPGSRNRPPMT